MIADRLFGEPEAVDGSPDGAATPDRDPATEAWLARVARLRARSSGRKQLALIIGAVVVVDLVLALVIPRLLPFLVFQRSTAVAAAAPAPADRKPAAVLPGAPADRVLAQVVADPALLPTGWSRVGAATTAYGSPYARACPGALPAGTTGVAARFVSGRLAGTAGAPGDVGVGLALTALPAGQGTLAVDRVRAWLQACPGADGLDPSVVGGPLVDPLAGADALVAQGGSGPAVTWVVWARGDLVVAASVTGLTSTSGQWPGVVAAVDAVVQRHLRPVCADLAPTADDAHRNPALPGYKPWAPTQTVAVPEVDVVPDPPAVAPAPVTLPEAVPHPDLAPVVIPDRSTWADTNGDGVGDLPPPVSSAPRGSVPVFRDPGAIAVPDSLVTVAPAEPARPTVPPASQPVPVPAVDARGPGCGWAFSGGAVPGFDEAAIAGAGQKAKEAALAAAAAAADTYRVQEEAWLPAEQTYLEERASFTTWSGYDSALAQARQELAQAQSAHDDSLLAYAAVVASATPATPTPTDTPTTTPTTTPSTPPTTPSDTTTSTTPGPGG